LAVLGVLLAAFVSGPKPAVRPVAAAVKPVPQVARTAGKVERARPLERLLQGWTVADTVPLVLKPEWDGGPAAALCVKF